MYKLHLKSSKSSIFLFLGIVLMPFFYFPVFFGFRIKKITQIIVSFHLRSAVLSFCICFRFCSGKESCRTQKQTSENHISSYLRASYCFLLSFFTFVSFFYKAKPSMKTAHTEITFLLLFTPFSVTRFAMHRIYANRINSRGMSRVFCDLRSQKTPRGILPVNSNPDISL